MRRNSSKNRLLKRPDIHAVIIVLPIQLLPSTVLKCLQAGKHVLSEKPVAPTVSEGLTLISFTEKYTKGEKPLVWRVAENFECDPSTIIAQKLVMEGKIGKVTSFTLVALSNVQKDWIYYQTPWRTIPNYQGGFLLDAGVHFAAMLRTVLPVPLYLGERKEGTVKVSGWAGLVRDFLLPEDTMGLSVSFGAGKEGGEGNLIAPSAVGTFNLSFAAPSSEIGDKKDGFVVMGTEGWMEYKFYTTSQNGDGRFVGRITVHRRKEGGSEGEEVEVYEVEANQGVTKEIELLLRVIQGQATNKEKSFGNPKKALWDVAFIEAGLKSKGCAIDLGELLAGNY
jgi:predicted dehydrogenase